MVSVLILTYNEEKDLPECLKSVDWSDDIHVFDSFSNDSTIDIAHQLGVNVFQRKFDNYAAQRNAALENIKFKYPWILILDADERASIELAEEIKLKTNTASKDTNGFRIRRRDYLGKTWLKHSQITPFYIRLIRAGYAHYHREINEVLEVQGKVEDIEIAFNHFPFSKGYSHWIKKHNTYSTMEAKRWIQEHDNNFDFSIKKALFSSDFSIKRYHQKGLFYKLPFRPLVKWLYMVIVRKAILDGKAGITYATLQAIYEYFIVIKTKEIISGF